MGDVKVGQRGKVRWGDARRPEVIGVRGPWLWLDFSGEGVMTVHRDDFTPDPSPPTTVMVEMSVEDARWWAEGHITGEAPHTQRVHAAAARALKEAGL